VGSGIVATAILSYVGRGLSGAVESVSDTMCDVCNASLYKKSFVPANNDTREPKTVLNPFPTLSYLGTIGTCEAQTEACMALPGPAKGLAVATVTYINYPSRRKP